MGTVKEGLFGLPASDTPSAERVRATAPLRRLVERAAASVLLYGPPGTGKTTIARLLATVESRQALAPRARCRVRPPLHHRNPPPCRPHADHLGAVE